MKTTLFPNPARENTKLAQILNGPRKFNKSLIIIILALLVNLQISLAQSKFEPTYSYDLPPKGENIVYDKQGGIQTITTSTWVDRVKTKNGLHYHKFVQGFDYQKKQGFIRIYDDKGKLLQENWNKNIQGGVAQEELLKAFELVKNNPIVKKHFKQTKDKISLYGGFNFIDNSQCQLGNRCVHVMANTVNNPMVAHAIVRLTDAKVVYPDYDMDKSKWTIPRQKLVKKSKE